MPYHTPFNDQRYLDYPLLEGNPQKCCSSENDFDGILYDWQLEENWASPIGNELSSWCFGVHYGITYVKCINSEVVEAKYVPKDFWVCYNL